MFKIDKNSEDPVSCYLVVLGTSPSHSLYFLLMLEILQKRLSVQVRQTFAMPVMQNSA